MSKEINLQIIDNRINFKLEFRTPDLNVNIIRREGKIYLSFYGIYLSSGKTWYEIPIEAIKSIELVKEDNPKLIFRLEDMNITITSQNPSRLRAIRHLLLPFIMKTEVEMASI